MKSFFLKVPSYTMVPNKKGEWISEGELHFRSKSLGVTLIVPKHSLNNLASIPRGFRTMFPVNGVSRPAAALHDHLYNVKGQGIQFYAKGYAGFMDLTREQADMVFKEALQCTRLNYIEAVPRATRNALDDLGKLDFFTSDKNMNLPLCGTYQTYIMHKAVRLGGSLYWS